MWFLLMTPLLVHSFDSLNLNSEVVINNLNLSIKEHLQHASESISMQSTYRKSLRIFEFHMEDYILSCQPMDIHRFVFDCRDYRLSSDYKRFLENDGTFIFKTDDLIKSSPVICVAVGFIRYQKNPEITTNAFNKVRLKVNEHIFRELLYEKIMKK